MSKRKKFKKKHGSKQKTLEKSKSNTSDSRKSIGSKLWLIVQIIMGVLSLWGIILTTWVIFYPRVSVCPGDALDSSNPANTPFIIKNQGYVSIHNVVSSSPMNIITYPGGTVAKAEVPFDNSFSNPQQVAKVIAPEKQFTILLPFIYMENNKIEESDIAIKLTFNPIKWLPWQYETIHRFVSVKDKDGQWKWYPQPIDK